MTLATVLPRIKSLDSATIDNVSTHYHALLTNKNSTTRESLGVHYHQDHRYGKCCSHSESCRILLMMPCSVTDVTCYTGKIENVTS